MAAHCSPHPKDSSPLVSATPSTSTTATAISTAIPKPKQTKSRNGCTTCKAKRLKCDEAKPTCRQCQKRNVTCGGYKKDFKWRSFEKSNFAYKPVSKGKKASEPASETPAFSAKSTAAGGLEGSVAIVEDDNLQHPITCSPIISQPSLTFEIPSKEISVSWFSGPIEASPEDDDIILHDTFEQTPQTSDLSSDTQTLISPTIDFDHLASHVPLTSPLAKDQDDEVEEVVQYTPFDNNCGWDEIIMPSIIVPGSIIEPSIFRGPSFSSGSPEVLLMRFDQRTCGILSVKDGIMENPWRTLVWPLAANSPALYHAICSLSAFHWSKEEPQLRVCGMDHMRRSVRILASNLREMRTDAALATTLVLAFAEAWDRHISSGIQHLRGAKALVSRALAYQQQNTLQQSDLSRLRFLCNAWTYVSVIARLTSVEDVGCWELSLPFACEPPSHIHEIDPLMGCATTLFPLIGRVADLVRRVRITATNSIAVISQAIELKTLIEQWEAPKYFEEPEDPTSEVQHSYQTAQAYRWATLLHIHQAVPEIPSESAADLAKRVLVMLATVPPSSRTMVVHIYPLLVASCEVESEEDRNWVRERWAAMQSRLMIGNIDRCLEVIYEVWDRRDEQALRRLANQRVSFSFVMPMDTLAWRNTVDFDSVLFTPDSEEADEPPFWGLPDMDSDRKRRRFSADDVETFNSGSSVSSWRSTAVAPRRPAGLDNVEYEKSVRGRMHWAGVMRDWNWEVLLG